MRGKEFVTERRWMIVAGAVAFTAAWIMFAEVAPRARAVTLSAIELRGSGSAKLDPHELGRHLQQLQNRRSALESDLARVMETGGCETCTADVFGRLRRLIDESGVALIEFRPGAHVLEETTIVTPVEIIAAGGYLDVGRFIDTVERLDNVVAVKRLEAKATDASGQLDIRLSLEIVTIRETP